jgi:hypothetical protein
LIGKSSKPSKITIVQKIDTVVAILGCVVRKESEKLFSASMKGEVSDMPAKELVVCRKATATQILWTLQAKF